MRTHPVQLIKKPGERSIDAACIVHLQAAARGQTSDRHRHGDSMITIGLYACRLKGLAASNRHTVFPLFDLDPQMTKAFRYGGDTIRLFVAEFFYPRDRGHSLRHCSGYGQDGIFIDGSRYHLRADVDTCQFASVHFNVGLGLAGFYPLIEKFDSGTHTSEDFDYTIAGRVHADIAYDDLRTGNRCRGHEEKRRRRNIARYAHLSPAEFLPAGDRDRTTVNLGFAAEALDHQFGVIA